MENPAKEKILKEFEKEIKKTCITEGQHPEVMDAFAFKIYQKSKDFLSQKLDEYAMEVVKKCLPEELDPKTYENPLGLHGADDEYVDAGVIQGFNSARTQMLERSKEILDIK